MRVAVGWPVTSASPLTSTPSTTNEQCPPVWPGLGMAIGAPGRAAATSSVSACVVGMPSWVNAPLRLIATDHFSQRGCQSCAATSDRRSLLEVLALGVADLVGVAIHRCAMGFREPDRRAEVVDVGVGQQDRAQVVDAEAELAQRVQHVVAAAGEPRVDQDHAAVVGDQGPVDQVGVREMDAVGDGREGRCHVCECRAAGGRNEAWLN